MADNVAIHFITIFLLELVIVLDFRSYLHIMAYCEVTLTFFLFQRHSLRDLAYIRTKFFHEGTKYNLEGDIIKGKTTNISGAGFVDFQNIKTSATVNLTSGYPQQ